MKIAICDDDKEFRKTLEKHVNTYAEEKSLTYKMYHFSCGEEILESREVFDIIFLDVEMGGMNGIDVGQELHDRNPYSIIFIVTSHNGFLDSSFKIRAFRFLTKPIEILRLHIGLDDAMETMSKEKIAFHDMGSGRNIRISAGTIVYLEVDKKRVKMVTTEGVFFSNESISHWKDTLKASCFVCPHSSYVINMNYATSHTRTNIWLRAEDEDEEMQEYEIGIAPKKQSEMKKIFFYVSERR